MVSPHTWLPLNLFDTLPLRTHGTPGSRSRMEVSAAGSKRPSLWFVVAESKAAPKRRGSWQDALYNPPPQRKPK